MKRLTVPSILIAVLLALTSPLTAQTRDSVYCVKCVPVVGTATDSTPRTVSIAVPAVTPPPVSATVYDRRTRPDTTYRDSIVKVPVATGVAAITVEPGSATVATKGKVTFAAKGWPFPPANGPVAIPSLKWSATGGSITSAGVFTAGTTAGSYIVTATSGTITGTSTVTVTGSTTPPPSGSNAMYFNSAESACDATAILCDDFEDGDWYTKDADQAGASSGGYLAQDGWHGTIYGNPITPAGAAVCGARGAKGTNCAASYGTSNGSGDGVNYADHAFANGPVDELSARWYYKADAGYQWGGEKHTNFTKTAGDISFFNIQINCGASGARSTGQPFIQVIHGGTTGCFAPTEGSFSFTSGDWFYIEVHAKLNTQGQANGLVEMWINNCGTTGVCTGTPTLRTRLASLNFDRNQSPSKKIEILWFERWYNPASKGTAYLDQIVVRPGNSRIGF